MTISEESKDVSESESNMPMRKSARISVRGRRRWTDLFRKGRKTANQALQIQKGRYELRKTCPKEVRIVVERLGGETSKSNKTAEKPPAKRKKNIKASPKQSAKNSAEPNRKRVKIEDDVQRLMTFGAGFQQPEDGDEGSGGGSGVGNCAVCHKYIENGTVLDSLTVTSKIHFHQKLLKVAAGEAGLVINEDGVLCPVCTRLLNYMDRIEVELSMLSTAILNCMRKRRVVEKQPCRTIDDDQMPPDRPGRESKANMGPKTVEQVLEDLETVDEQWEETIDSHRKPDVSEPTNEVLQNSLEPAKPPSPSPPPPPPPPQPLPATLETETAKEAEPEVPSEQYQCSICSYKTSFKSVIIFHLRQHVKDSYRCDFCNITIPKDSDQMMRISSLRHLRYKGNASLPPPTPLPTLPPPTPDLSADNAIPSSSGNVAAKTEKTGGEEDTSSLVEKTSTSALPCKVTIKNSPKSDAKSPCVSPTEMLTECDPSNEGNSSMEVITNSQEIISDVSDNVNQSPTILSDTATDFRISTAHAHC